jgi:transposase
VVGTILASSGLRRTSRKGCPNHAVEFKRRLAIAACEPGVSVARLALEHRINANLLFKWRRQYRAGKFDVPSKRHATPVWRQLLFPLAFLFVARLDAGGRRDWTRTFFWGIRGHEGA